MVFLSSRQIFNIMQYTMWKNKRNVGGPFDNGPDKSNFVRRKMNRWKYKTFKTHKACRDCLRKDRFDFVR